MEARSRKRLKNKMTENMRIKIGVFDDKNNFIGYQVDEFWTPNENYPKEFNSKEGEIENENIHNLEYICNNYPPSNIKTSVKKIATFNNNENHPGLNNALKIYQLVKSKNKYVVELSK